MLIIVLVDVVMKERLMWCIPSIFFVYLKVGLCRYKKNTIGLISLWKRGNFCTRSVHHLSTGFSQPNTTIENYYIVTAALDCTYIYHINSIRLDLFDARVTFDMQSDTNTLSCVRNF